METDKDKEMEGKLSLGIDLGTTSVKTCLINISNGKILHSISRPTHADVPSSEGVKSAEQDPQKILQTLKQILHDIPMELRSRIDIVCITGQMHGVMLWTKHSLKKHFSNVVIDERVDNLVEKGEYADIGTSNLFTWQDQRCSSEFLSSLPKPDSHLPIATGHGCATMLWLNKYCQSYINRYDCSGTIMDYVVAGLCGLEKPVMSVQLASSWGYFSTREMSWNYSQLSQCGLHIDLLPYVIGSGQIAGAVQHEWCGIRAGTTVMAALGDVQCAVYSVIKSPQDAVLNMSTSCQLAFSVKEELVPVEADSTCPVQYFPYFEETYLAIAASLNGGNVLAHFVTMLRQWMQVFGFTIEEEKVWSSLADVSTNNPGSDCVKVIPALYGERHNPLMTASITGLKKDNLDIGTIFRSLCKSLIENISSMMAVSFLEAHGITNLIGSGSLLSRNEVIKQEVKKHYGNLTVEFGSSCDSATGAAMYAIRHV